MVWAHAEAHHRGGYEAHPHVASLEAHDGPAELAAPDRSESHPHARLDQATRAPTHQLLLGPPAAATTIGPDVAWHERVADPPAATAPASGPPGDDPPRLRAPPLR
jgi:hypothetical protein